MQREQLTCPQNTTAHVETHRRFTVTRQLCGTRAAARVHFPETGVGRFLALVRRARLVVGNDSAAMHMAVGVGRPLVAIFLQFPKAFWSEIHIWDAHH